MSKFTAAKFSSEAVEYETPMNIFAPLDREFNFTTDVAATELNKKCPKFFTRADDGLSQKWEGVCWMNPPYGRGMEKWLLKAQEAAKHGATIVCLVPARTNTGWWHDICAKQEVRFIRGRPRFNNGKHGLPQPLAIVIFRGRG